VIAISPKQIRIVVHLDIHPEDVKRTIERDQQLIERIEKRNNIISTAMLPRINPTNTQAWFLLKKHHEEEMSRRHMRDLFCADADRFQKFSIRLEDILFDYSKNIINQKTLQLLLQLAEDCQLKDAIHDMFAGIKINETEHRSVLHTALRNFSDSAILVEGKDIMPRSAKCRIR
jgi:hypothetical protein